MSNRPVPAIQRHFCRPTTKASARRGFDRLAANLNNPAQSDIVGSAVSHVAVVRSTNSSAIGTGINVPWDVELVNTDAWWVTGTNTRITVDRDGLYLVQAAMTVVAITSGSFATMSVLKNGAGSLTIPYCNRFSTNVAQNISLESSFVYSMVAGDYLYVRITSDDNSGTIGVASNNGFAVTYMGTV